MFVVFVLCVVDNFWWLLVYSGVFYVVIVVLCDHFVFVLSFNVFCLLCFFFFFKQKTAYEMRISDWSSDVCSSDLGAGAKLVGTFAYELTAADCRRIEELAPDIMLLAGGTDGGNRDVILRNAAVLAKSALDCPIIIAGNRNAADEAAARLGEGGKTATICGNVMPEFNQLDVEPARAAIRRIFIDRIVHAKGIDRAREKIGRAH